MLLRQTFPFPESDAAVVESIREAFRRRYYIKMNCVWFDEEQTVILNTEIQKERERNQTFVALNNDGRRMRVWKTPGISLPSPEVVKAVAPKDASIHSDNHSQLFDVTPRPLDPEVAWQMFKDTGEHPHPPPFDVDDAIQKLESNRYRLAETKEIPESYQDLDVVVYVRDANPGV